MKESVIYSIKIIKLIFNKYHDIVELSEFLIDTGVDVIDIHSRESEIFVSSKRPINEVKDTLQSYYDKSELTIEVIQDKDVINHIIRSSSYDSSEDLWMETNDKN